VASTTQLVLVGHVDQARAITDSVLAYLGFRVFYQDPWTGMAERGNQTATVLGGAFAGDSQHIKIGVAYRAGAPGQTVLILSKATTGMAAGIIGVSRTNKVYDEAVGRIRAALASSGQLIA